MLLTIVVFRFSISYECGSSKIKVSDLTGYWMWKLDTLVFVRPADRKQNKQEYLVMNVL